MGRIVSARPGEFFQEITVEPAARLTRLQHVLVLAGPAETLNVTAEATGSEGPPR